MTPRKPLSILLASQDLRKTPVYAVIQTGGKQLRVQVGEVVRVERLPVEVGAPVVFDRVLMLGGDKAKLGSPIVVKMPSRFGCAGSKAWLEALKLLGITISPGARIRSDSISGLSIWLCGRDCGD